MSTYLQFAVIKFRNKTAYRFDYLLGILNTLLSFVVYWSIYKALYSGASEVDGVTFSMVTTNFIISLGLSSAFHKNEMFLQDKIKQGTIANELLKPVNFKLRMLFEDVGEGAFNVVFHFLPTVVIAGFFANLSAPSSVLNVLLCLVSVILGYIVLWQISFIVQSWSFWLFSVWGFITIKNVFVNILAGAYIPMWFMPDWLRSVIRFTPFDSIYFMPVQLYLGELQGWDILINFARQLLWIVILYGIGEFSWRKGIKKLVVQGG
ncbi:MAG: ABC-2 family transporter protein [Lachnospiraceae bacterium]|nr:ABC-2 family transporter protein [Lachnospiraceae bacterium]